jgi:signal transduction histidine kinase/CHASE3 domain sensor protein/FixJ family two-component response regulator
LPTEFTKANFFALISAVVLMGIIGSLSWLQFTSSREAEKLIRHTHEVITTADHLSIAIRDAESNQRDFLLTGDEQYLVPYRDDTVRVVLLQGELRRLTADNPDQQDRLRALTSVIQQKLEVLAQTAHLRQAVGMDAALANLRTGVRQRIMDQIRTSLTQVQREEDLLLAQRRASAVSAEDYTRWIALGAGAVAVGLLALSVRLLTGARAQIVASESEQRSLAEHMRATFDSISQGVGVFGPDYRLVRWNGCFPTVLNLAEPMPRQGTPYQAIVARITTQAGGKGPILETEDQIRHGAPRSGKPVVYERTRGSDDRSFEIRRTPMPDGGFVLTIADRTERVHAERTSRTAQRLQAMGQLTGGIAHDFNNLLQVVLGNLDVVRPKLEAGSPFLKRIEQAIWAVERGGSLTRQLLAFARRQPLSPMPIDISVILPEMTDLLRRTLGEQIDLRVAGTPGLWAAMADGVQVESAVLNLALNARDAMPGGGRLTIEAENKVLDTDYARQHTDVLPGDYVMLAVSDTGIGMSPDVLARVFEPFFTTKDPDKGTGLGLPMVYGFAKQSGGHVKVDSEIGRGTTVRLYLPRAIGVRPHAWQRSTGPGAVPRGSSTILVVEDDAAVREVAVTMLRELGYRVLEASDGSEALRVFGEDGHLVDVLLVDVVLPGGMKGNEVARRIAEKRPAVRTLFMSGYAENAIGQYGSLHDGIHLIGKPFSSELLARKVAEVLGLPASTPHDAEDGKIIDLATRNRVKRT